MKVSPTAVRPILPDDFDWYQYRHLPFSLGLKTEDAVYLSGHSSSVYGETGSLHAHGSIGDQVREIYRKQSVVLASAGYGLANVVHVMQYVRSDSWEKVSEVDAVTKDLLFNNHPAVTTVFVDTLIRNGATIKIALDATTQTSKRYDDCLDSSIGVGANGSLHLPTIVPTGPGGAVWRPGDLSAQYQCCLQNVKSLLHANGLTIDNVVSLTERVRSDCRDEVGALDSLRLRAFCPPYPALTRLLVDRLVPESSSIQLDVVASREKPTKSIGSDPSSGASAAVIDGKLLHIGACTARGGTPKQQYSDNASLIEQAADVYAQLQKLCATAGARCLLRTTEFIRSDQLANYAALGGEREAVFDRPFPVSVTLGMKELYPVGCLITVPGLATF